MSARERECKGCGGSGCGCVEKSMAVFRAVGSASEPCVDCPACLGSGRVTDGPFRRDAEMDAETLQTEKRAMSETAWLASQIEWRMRVGMRSAAVWAVDAARAAFRACPGLRGE